MITTGHERVQAIQRAIEMVEEGRGMPIRSRGLIEALRGVARDLEAGHQLVADQVKALRQVISLLWSRIASLRITSGPFPEVTWQRTDTYWVKDELEEIVASI